jgi:hypothetical protein
MILSTQKQRMLPLATDSLFTYFFWQMLQKKRKEKKAYVSEGNLEQTMNCICGAQTLNRCSDFVNGPIFIS